MEPTTTADTANTVPPSEEPKAQPVREYPDARKPAPPRVERRLLRAAALPPRVTKGVTESNATGLAFGLRQAVWLAAGLFLLYTFFDAVSKAVLLFLTALLIAIVLNAPVRLLERRGISRGFSTSVVALFVLGSIGFSAYHFGPPLVEQAAVQVKQAPEEIKRIRTRIDQATDRYPALKQFVGERAFASENIQREVNRVLPRVGRFTLGALEVVVSGFVVFVVALYTLGSPVPLLRALLAVTPPEYRRPAVRSLTRIVGQLEAWALATLLLMATVGIAVGIGLAVIGVKNAVLWGVIAAIGEGIPTVGPVLSALPPTIAAFSDDPHKALWVLGLFLVVQQTEGHLLVPMIMSRRLSLHPVAILFFVVTLGSLLGFLGALLAVPAVIVFKILIEEFYIRRMGRTRPALLTGWAARIVHPGERKH